MNDVLKKIQGGLIVSCQALEDEPLHGPMLMGAMAFAAKEGGAVGIRSNGSRDVAVIKALTGLPVIGIEKHTNPAGGIVITPTFEAAKRLVDAGADIIAFDARFGCPREIPLPEFIGQIKSELGCIAMADIGNIEEAIAAAKAGADIVASTFGGIHDERGDTMNWDLIKAMTSKLSVPVIAEGGIWNPEEACKALQMGVHAVVVGTAITRPQLITRRFATMMASVRPQD